MQREKIDIMWYATKDLSGDPQQVTLDDYYRLEDIMLSWYEAGKMEITGWVHGDVTGAYLTSKCNALDLRGDDDIAYMKVTSGLEGVHQIEVQTIKHTSITIGDPSPTLSIRNTFDSTNWVNFNDGMSFAGLWGVTDSETGTLTGLSFVERDDACFNRFANELEDKVDWDTPLRGTSAPKVALPSEY